MKRHCLFFALWLFAIAACAQPGKPATLPVLQPDTAFIYGTKGNIYGFYHYIYDEKALRTEEHYYVSDNGKFREQTRRFYTYDSRGNVLVDFQQQIIDGKWENQFQNIYAYDSRGNRTLNHNQLWVDSLGRWYNAHRFHYVYNAQNLVDTFFREDDDSSYIARLFYHYNSFGSLTLEQWQFWNDTGWNDIYRATITYDTCNRMLTYLEENWNHTHGGPPKLIWEPWLNYIYTYDSLGNKTKLFTRTWSCNDEKWFNEKNIIYTYDSLQRCTEECFYAWSRGNNERWVKHSRTFYTYDDRDLLVYSEVQTPLNDNWINNTATAFSYDNLGYLTSKMVKIWDIGNVCWENNALYDWRYHRNGALLYESYANWNPQKEDWQGVYRCSHAFNENDDEEEVTYEMYDTKKGWYPFDNTLYLVYHNNMDTLGTFHTSKVRVCYRLLEDSLPGEGVANIRDNRLQCSPNPTSDKLYVTAEGTEILDCRLYTADGRLCMECRPMQSYVELSTAQLSKGVYIIHCVTGKGTLNQTIIKR